MVPYFALIIGCFRNTWMWCSVCQSDVATEVGADNRRVSCSNCGHLLGGATGAASTSATRTTPSTTSGSETRAEEARQLLDRWAKGHFFDPYGPPRKTGVDVSPRLSTSANKTAIEEEVQSAAVGAEQTPATSMESAEDNCDRETVDEQASAAAPQQSTVPSETKSESAVAPAIPQTDRREVAVKDTGQRASITSNASARESDASDPPPPLTAKASSEELDRLTREIMDRVSRITEARDAARTEESGSRASVEESSKPPVETEPEAGSTDSQREVRPDRADRFDEDQPGNSSTDVAEIAAFTSAVKTPAKDHIRTDTSHRSAADPVAFQKAPPTNPSNSSSPGGWYNNIGQMLAYLGIICLTAGTCGVIVSYFGGPANYAPYGWLGATIGQMLLFLGIVTLISAGMEQTSQELRQAVDQRMDEVTQRLDLIGNRIMRIEEANLDGPPRPHLLSSEERDRRSAGRTTRRSVHSDD